MSVGKINGLMVRWELPFWAVRHLNGLRHESRVINKSRDPVYQEKSLLGRTFGPPQRW